MSLKLYKKILLRSINKIILGCLGVILYVRFVCLKETDRKIEIYINKNSLARGSARNCVGYHSKE